MDMRKHGFRLLHVLLLGGLGASGILCFATSPGVAAALSSHAPAQAQESQMQPKSSNILFCVGDSIVEGLRLHEAAGFTVFNAGVSGAGVRTFLQRAGDILTHTRGATVLLAIGVNDAGRGPAFSAETWEADYRALCAQLAAGAVRFIAQTVLPVEKLRPWGDQAFFVKHINMMNAIIRKVAQERSYWLIDMHAHFADADGFMPAGGTTDGVHLTGASYAKWREYWEEQLPRCRQAR